MIRSWLTEIPIYIVSFSTANILQTALWACITNFYAQYYRLSSRPNEELKTVGFVLFMAIQFFKIIDNLTQAILSLQLATMIGSHLRFDTFTEEYPLCNN